MNHNSFIIIKIQICNFYVKIMNETYLVLLNLAINLYCPNRAENISIKVATEDDWKTISEIKY